MTRPHPSYDEHAGSDPFHCYGRWVVTGTCVWTDTVEHAVEAGMSPQEIVADNDLPAGSLVHVAAIHDIHRRYLARVGRPVAA